MDDIAVDMELVALKRELRREVDRVASEEDPYDREMEARELSRTLQVQQTRFRRMRAACVRAWKAGGADRSMRKAAETFGLHRKTLSELMSK